MRIKIEMYVEVDPAAWTATTGIGDSNGRATAAAVREDVRSFVINAVQQLAMFDETDATVTRA